MGSSASGAIRQRARWRQHPHAIHAIPRAERTPNPPTRAHLAIIKLEMPLCHVLDTKRDLANGLGCPGPESCLIIRLIQLIALEQLTLCLLRCSSGHSMMRSQVTLSGLVWLIDAMNKTGAQLLMRLMRRGAQNRLEEPSELSKKGRV